MAVINAEAFSSGKGGVIADARCTYSAEASSAGIATVAAATLTPLVTAEKNYDLERAAYSRQPIINWFPYSGPPLSELETGAPHIYIFATQSDPRSKFPGALIESSDASALCFECVGKVVGSSVIGFVTSTSGMGAGLAGQWDYENSVEVTLFGDGELSSWDQCSVLNGRNLIQIGGEILAYANATVKSDDARTYTLDTFLRGLMDTDPAAHNTAGESFIFLNSKNRVPVRVDTGDIDVPKVYRVYTPSKTPDVDDDITLTVGAENMDPFQITTFGAIRNFPSTNDWFLTWCRRTRNPKPRIFAERGIVDVDPRVYVLQPLDGVGGDPQNTYSPTTESYTYTAAQQVTDFGSVQSTINIQLARINGIHPGGGKFLEKQFTG